MRTNLRPDEGIAVVIGGVEFRLLFTFAAIDALQTLYNEPIADVVRKLTDNMTVYAAAGHILQALIESDLYNHGEVENAPTYEQIMHVLDMKDGGRITATILRAFGIDMPEPDDDENEDDEEHEAEKMNITRLLMIARTELHMSEEEFWKTTPRKFFMLFDEYIKWKGGGKGEESSVDSLP